MVQQGGRVLEVRSIQVHQKHLKLCLHPEFQGKRRYINIHKHVWRFSKMCFVKTIQFGSYSQVKFGHSEIKALQWNICAVMRFLCNSPANSFNFLRLAVQRHDQISAKVAYVKYRHTTIIK